MIEYVDKLDSIKDFDSIKDGTPQLRTPSPEPASYLGASATAPVRERSPLYISAVSRDNENVVFGDNRGV